MENANLILKNSFDGSTHDINGVDLENTTPSQIINAAIQEDILARIKGEEYRLVGKNNQPILDDEPLAKLGFVDGDTITVISKPSGAALLA